MTELKQRAEQAAKNLDVMMTELDRAFKVVETDSLKNGVDNQDLNAYLFLQNVVKTHRTTISEVKAIFMLCVAAHEQYKDALAMFKAVRALVSVKGIILTVGTAAAVIAYKVMEGGV